MTYHRYNQDILSIYISFYNMQVYPNEDEASALDSVKSLFTSGNGSSLADSLIKSGDFGTLANIAEAGASILNNQMKPSSNSSLNSTSFNSTNANDTNIEEQKKINDTLDRINVC